MRKEAPILISGLGGSGTRVVAEILLRKGVFLGGDLNKSLDNLQFTYFFKHPTIFTLSNPPTGLVHQLVKVHDKVFRCRGDLTVSDIRWLIWAGLQHGLRRYYYGFGWVFKRLRKIVELRHAVNNTMDIWGWKEPHIVYFLHPLLDYYPAAKVVLLLRHGLDMAFSKNDQQFRLWRFDDEIEYSPKTPRARFEYWYRFNKLALGILEQRLDEERFLVLKLEDLYGANKRKGILRLLKFVDSEIDSVSDDFLKIPQVPSSHRRYLKHNTSWIDCEVEQKLTEFGYSVHFV